MRNNRLHSSKRQHEIIELCQLERLVMAAGMGTAWLDDDAMDPATKKNTDYVQALSAMNTGLCSWMPEDCHVHA